MQTSTLILLLTLLLVLSVSTVRAVEEETISSSMSDEFKAFEEKKEFVPPKSYVLEIWAVVLIVAYSVNFYVGRNKNNEIAEKLFETILPTLQAQFAVLGAYDVSKKAALIKESHQSYKLYCSGRRNCDGILISIQLEKRQDLFYIVMKYLGLAKERDVVSFEVTQSTDNPADPMILCLAQQGEEEGVISGLQDVSSYTIQYKSSKLPERLIFRAEALEIESMFTDQKVCEILHEHSNLISFIHFSDETDASPVLSNRLLRFHFIIKTEDYGVYAKLLSMACFLIDKHGSSRLKPQIRKQIEKKRSKVKEKLFRASHKERLEEAQRLKEEKLKGMSKEELSKKEEKDMRRRQKKRGQKVMVLK